MNVNCANCKQCLVSIPLGDPENGNGLKRRLKYKRASVRCAKGLWYSAAGGEFRLTRWFYAGCMNTKRLETAQNCHEYDPW